MAIVKLVCQGCGANLDAKDDLRVVACGYCGINNQIKQTVQPAPRPVAPPPAAPPHSHAPPSSPYSPSASHQQTRDASKQTAGVVKWIVIGGLVFPLLLAGFIGFIVLRTTSEAFDRVGLTKDGRPTLALDRDGRRFRWDSPRPFVADVNQDGVDDLIGAIQETGSQQLLLTSMSGADWSTIWEVDLGLRADLPDPTFYFEPGSQLVLFSLGATLHAYEGQSGQPRWLASLPDKLDAIGRTGEQLWVKTIDGAGHHLSLADGKLSPAKSKPGEQLRVLLDGEGYELIPILRTLDLRAGQYDDVEVQKAFCPREDLPFDVQRGSGKKSCANPHGLAFVTRDKGTKVPFLLGYERESKDERWRVQLTKAGTLETVDGGFGQPRAEYFGDDAIISFVRANQGNASIRRISLVDGATRWETQLTRKTTDNVDAMVVGKQFVFVTYGQRILALDVDSGEQVAELGGW